MCFKKLVNSKKDARPLIAEKDIVCYKIVFKKFLGLYYKSLYKKFIYYPFKLYKCDLDEIQRVPTFTSYFEIHEGFHSYKGRNIAEYWYENYEFPGMIVKFIIPKGSKYYENAREYVSNQIKVA